MADLRKYGVETRVYFMLRGRGTPDFLAGVTIAAGDAKISKDAGAYANVVGESADDLFVDEGGGLYSLKVAAAELQCASAAIKIVDQTAIKEWEDVSLKIETYGNASAQHAFDLDLAALTKAEVNAEVDTALSDYDGPTNTEFELRSLPSADYTPSLLLETTLSSDYTADAVIIYPTWAMGADNMFNDLTVVVWHNSKPNVRRIVFSSVMGNYLTIDEAFDATFSPVAGDTMQIFVAQKGTNPVKLDGDAIQQTAGELHVLDGDGEAVGTAAEQATIIAATTDIPTIEEIAEAVPTVDEIVAGIDSADYILDTVVSVANSDSSFTLAAGIASSGVYNYLHVTVEDASDGHRELRAITNWSSGRVITLDRPLTFTPAVSDEVHILEAGYALNINRSL